MSKTTDHVIKNQNNMPDTVVAFVQALMRVTRQDLDDIIVGAIEGGIDYWVDSIETSSPMEPQGMEVNGLHYAHEGFRINITSDEGESFTLTEDVLVDGIQRYVSEQAKYGDTRMGPGYFDQLDAADYDAIFQMACFKKLVYG